MKNLQLASLLATTAVAAATTDSIATWPATIPDRGPKYFRRKTTQSLTEDQRQWNNAIEVKRAAKKAKKQ